ncbi:MAG: SDR family NAD(P)-dependent oxidoreductase [Rhodocyclaceae bacterium]
MNTFAGKTYWLVGASEGLGRALALALSREGARLILSARSAERLAGLAAAAGGARMLPFDVRDPAAVARAAAEAGAVDGVIYAVGRYEPMTAAAWDPDESAAIAEVNLVGALRLLGHVVPAMVRRGSGHVVIIGSLAAHRGLPGAIGYGASKAALLSLAETMRADLRGTGVRVQIANPGFIRTRLTAKNAFAMPQMMEPEEAAARVVALMRSGRFRADFPVPFAWLFLLGRVLPLALLHRVVGRG